MSNFSNGENGAGEARGREVFVAESCSREDRVAQLTKLLCESNAIRAESPKMGWILLECKISQIVAPRIRSLGLQEK